MDENCSKSLFLCFNGEWREEMNGLISSIEEKGGFSTASYMINESIDKYDLEPMIISTDTTTQLWTREI